LVFLPRLPGEKILLKDIFFSANQKEKVPEAHSRLAESQTDGERTKSGCNFDLPVAAAGHHSDEKTC
jgi:hypothetical protein